MRFEELKIKPWRDYPNPEIIEWNKNLELFFYINLGIGILNIILCCLNWKRIKYRKLYCFLSVLSMIVQLILKNIWRKDEYDSSLLPIQNYVFIFIPILIQILVFIKLIINIKNEKKEENLDVKNRK